MSEKKTITPDFYIRCIYKAIVISSIISALMFVIFAETTMQGVSKFVEAAFFGIVVSVLSYFAFMFYLDRYLIMKHPECFIEEAERNDESSNLKLKDESK